MSKKLKSVKNITLLKGTMVNLLAINIDSMVIDHSNSVNVKGGKITTIGVGKVKRIFIDEVDTGVKFNSKDMFINGKVLSIFISPKISTDEVINFLNQTYDMILSRDTLGVIDCGSGYGLKYFREYDTEVISRKTSFLVNLLCLNGSKPKLCKLYGITRQHCHRILKGEILRISDKLILAFRNNKV